MIRHAKTNDLNSILSVYIAAKGFMLKNNNPHQWSEGYLTRELFENDIAKNQLYVCVDTADKIYGAFAFIIGEDITYAVIENGSWLNNEPYGTIHRIASSGERQGVFDECISFCKSQIANLRIDTHEANTVMQHLIKKHGFIPCGTIYVGDNTPRLAFQYVPSIV